MEVRLPLGIDQFEKLRTSDCYYIDKTGFIRELLCERAALLQIREKQHGRKLLKGYERILCYGAAFFENMCLVKVEKDYLS